MSKPWRPDSNAGPLQPSTAWREWARIQGCWPEQARGPMPEGAKVGLLLIAAACVGAAIAVYQVWGPSDTIARDDPGSWNSAHHGDRADP